MTFQTALENARRGQALHREELIALLGADGEERADLYALARSKREERFGSRVFAYGFVYFSTYCRNNCAFCFYRRDNCESLRYRKPREEILEISRDLTASGVHLLDLTMGEDPLYVGSSQGVDQLLRLVEDVKRETGMPVMLSPGVLPAPDLRRAAAAGAQWYACYQETHNRRLFARLRGGQSFDERLHVKRAARDSGMLVEEGILVGVGETLGDIADSILAMGDLGAAQVRVMSFVPQQGAPLRVADADSLVGRELNTIAVMRLALPGRLIPASLDVAGHAGLRERLDAGANVVTSIIAPESGLAGVSNATLDVDNGHRSLPGIADTLRACGLEVAGRSEYAAAMERLGTECERGEGSGGRRAAAGS